MKPFFTNLWQNLRDAAKEFVQDLGPLMASAISFYAILSLLPLLLLGVSIFAFFLGSSDQAFGQVLGYFRQFIPAQAQFIEEVLRSLVKARGVIGVVGLVSLLWTGSQVFVTMEAALNVIWDVQKKRSFLKSRLLALILVGVIGVLFALSVGVAFALTFLSHIEIPGPGFRLSDIPFLSALVSVLLSLVFSMAMYAAIYKLMPNTEVRWRSAIYGGAIAAVVWEIAKRLYELYLSHFAQFGAVYGSLGSLVILVLWMYYSAIILLFCAEVAQVHQRRSDQSAPAS